jgi:ABC-type multidrug transport system ATPase subunit
VQVIHAENITHQYPNGRGIQNISFTLSAGNCLALVGENGSGKTTLLRLLAGIDRIDSGCLTVLGEPASLRSIRRRRDCGVALDISGHWEILSGRQNLWFFARSYGLKPPFLPQRVNQLLKEAGLVNQADESVTGYSFGMRRKLALVQAFCHDPDLLILDEPTAGVDTEFLTKLRQWIHSRNRRGKTTCIGDNNADWLTKVATDAVLLAEGRITFRSDLSDAHTVLRRYQESKRYNHDAR